jgi:hypothetical protein
MQRATYLAQLIEIMDAMEVGEKFNKKDFIKKVWLEHNYYVDRSFSVFLVTAKKTFADKKFRSINGYLVRLE